MILTHKIEIKPNSTTKKKFEEYFGYARYCYNKGLDVWNSEYKNGNKPTGRKVRDTLKSNKEEWEKDLSPSVLDTAIEDLEKGFKMYFKKINKHPKFKSKKRSNKSFRFYRKSDSSIRIKDNKLLLPKFPYPIKLTECIRFDGIIKTCTITQKADRYFASFSIETDILSNKNNNQNSVGIDLGIKEFAILGYSENNKRKYEHYKSLYKQLKPYFNKISIYQKILSRKIYNSNNYLKTKIKLQRVYLRIKNIQDDFLNKLSTYIVHKFKYITIENLNIKGLIKNRKLSEKISKSLFYNFRCKLEYKSKLYDNVLIIADRFFPSTQTCSNCGNIKIGNEKLKLSDRIYICPMCGHKEDRDENAAYNLNIYGANIVGLQL